MVNNSDVQNTQYLLSNY